MSATTTASAKRSRVYDVTDDPTGLGRISALPDVLQEGIFKQAHASQYRVVMSQLKSCVQHTVHSDSTSKVMKLMLSKSTGSTYRSVMYVLLSHVPLDPEEPEDLDIGSLVGSSLYPFTSSLEISVHDQTMVQLVRRMNRSRWDIQPIHDVTTLISDVFVAHTTKPQDHYRLVHVNRMVAEDSDGRHMRMYIGMGF